MSRPSIAWIRGSAWWALSLVSALLLGSCAQDVRPPAGAEAATLSVGYRRCSLEDGPRHRRVEVEIWYPGMPPPAGSPRTFHPFYAMIGLEIGLRSRVSTPDVPPRPGAVRGLVLLSHGYPGLPLESLRLVETLASHGLVVVAPLHRGSSVYDARDGTLTDPDIALEDRIADLALVHRAAIHRPDLLDVDLAGQAVVLAGDSLGVQTILHYAANPGVADGAGIRAYLGIAPGFSQPSADAPPVLPMLVLTGGEDPHRKHALQAIRAMLPQVKVVTIPGAGHAHFMHAKDIGDAFVDFGIPTVIWPCFGSGPAHFRDVYLDLCDPQGVPPETVLDRVCAETLAFLDEILGPPPGE